MIAKIYSCCWDAFNSYKDGNIDFLALCVKGWSWKSLILGLFKPTPRILLTKTYCFLFSPMAFALYWFATALKCKPYPIPLSHLYVFSTQAFTNLFKTLFFRKVLSHFVYILKWNTFKFYLEQHLNLQK